MLVLQISLCSKPAKVDAHESEKPIEFIIQEYLSVTNLICCYGWLLTIQCPQPCYHERKAGIPYDRNILLSLLNSITIFTTTVGTVTVAAALISIIIIIIITIIIIIIIIIIISIIIIIIISITIIIIIISPLHRAFTITNMKKKNMFLGYSVAAILWLQYMVHVILIPTINMYFYISISASTSAI